MEVNEGHLDVMYCTVHPLADNLEELMGTVIPLNQPIINDKTLDPWS